MEFNYDKSYPYLIACSGGPDSMALLNMLSKDGYKLIVCHVNYKTREASDYEQELVTTFCKKRNIKCYVSIYKEDNSKLSFEVKARNYRYNFFKSIYDKENAAGLFIAHHKDDVIETYLLKKRRNVINSSYLINEYSYVKKMKLIRPLVYNYYKEDLLSYCKENDIPYSIDITNFMDITLRNIIRKELVNQDKDKYYQEAIEYEKMHQEVKKEVSDFVKYYPVYTISLLKDKSDLFLSLFLHKIIDSKYKQKVNKGLLLKLKEFLYSDKPNLIYYVKDNYALIKEYDEILFFNVRNEDFCFVLDRIEYFDTPFFKIKDSGLKMQGIYLEPNDFPITIRNYKPEDKIKLKEGTKKVNRLFIDKKVPTYLRKMIPIIENKDHEIIFVYNLYRKYGYKYIKNNFFVLQ